MGGKGGICVRPAAALLAILLLVPASAFGEASDFLPTIYSSQGTLEVNMTHENNENTGGGRGTTSSDSYSVERLRLFLNGYVYHPRFIQFLARGAGGFSQERGETGQGTSFSDTRLALDHEFRTKVLPEHPYNLELYTLKMTPLVRGMSSAYTRITAYDKGAIFNYTGKPLSLNLGYNVNTISTRSSLSEARIMRATGSFVAGPTNSSAGYSHSDSFTSSGIHADGDSSFFDNTITLGRAVLYSGVRQNKQKQSALFSPSLVTDQFSWIEQFNADLPWNFSTAASYNVHKDSMAREETVATPASELANETRSSSITLSHKLYESVRTSYALGQSRSHSSQGDTKTETNALNSVYTKKIPDGRITIGVQGNRSDIDQNNGSIVVGQFYNAPLYGNFTLAGERIRSATITIRALTSSGALIDLIRNTHYIVEPSGNTVLITIVSLPPDVTLGRPPGYVYTFSVTYATEAVTAKLQLTTVGYTFNLALFGNLINPYYNNLHSRQAVLAGSIAGGPQDTKTDVVGITIQRTPYMLLSEYRVVDSDIYPSRSLRNSMEYTRKMTENTNLSMKTQFSKTDYIKGISENTGYSERVAGFDIRFQAMIPRSNFNFSYGASYNKRQAVLNTDIYSMSTDLTWLAGKLTVNAGASLNHSTTTAIVEKQTQLSEYYYLTVSRRLF